MLNVFISYAHNSKDVPLLSELKKHLLGLGDSINIWSDDQIPPGGDWTEFIHENLRQAHIVLLLISNDYFASDYCNKVEVKQAIRQQEMKSSEVVPILLRDCFHNKQKYSFLEFLPKMPTTGKLTAIELWSNKDEAFTVVVKHLNDLIERLLNRLGPSTINDSLGQLRENEVVFKDALFAHQSNHTLVDRQLDMAMVPPSMKTSHPA